MPHRPAPPGARTRPSRLPASLVASHGPLGVAPGWTRAHLVRCAPWCLVGPGSLPILLLRGKLRQEGREEVEHRYFCEGRGRGRPYPREGEVCEEKGKCGLVLIEAS